MIRLLDINLQYIIHNYGTGVSITLVLIIVLFTLLCYGYIRYVVQRGTMLEHRGVIEMLPSLVSTLGVLGTFLGITMGLYYFNEGDLSKSIPELLNGLRTAFFTSLAGMVGSIILSSYVNRLFDKEFKGISDSKEAAQLVAKEIQALKDNIDGEKVERSKYYKTVTEQLTQWNPIMLSLKDNIIALNTRIVGVYNSESDILKNVSQSNNRLLELSGKLDSVVESNNKIKEYTKGIGANTSAIVVASGTIAADATAIKGCQSSIDGKTESILISIGNIEDNSKTISDKASEQNDRIGEIMEHTESLSNGQDELSREVVKLGDKLHGEVLDIEEKMGNTNKLLQDKFDEFSELLKKSNTEALVNVMKKVTEEFQKQMKALISKLVQENFEQLNKSVERLNTWQQENKEMIQSLTAQYRQMAENFENTSTSLTKVDEDTKHLVSEGGKLHQIVDALNKVIVEDEKFIKISNDLQATTNLTKTNFEQFDGATKMLNEWVKKQRNFVDGVMLLIKKLEELDKLRDYSEHFWKDTKEKMNEGIGIIQGGTDTLNKQITELDSQFYARLSTTLTELDNCIQAFAEKAAKKNNITI